MLNWLKNIFGIKEELSDPMKYLIVGLGNMGAEYEDTRHNIGFKVVEQLAKEFEVPFKNDQLGDVAEFKHKGRTFVLIKPSTYMNLSGKAVRYWMQKKKIQDENLLIVLDDLNLGVGAQKIRAKGADGGHNGLKNITQILGRNNYARLRIGIGNDYSKGKQVDFVLGEWSSEEKEKLPEIIEYAGKAIKAFGSIGLSHTMNKFNRKAPQKKDKEET